MKLLLLNGSLCSGKTTVVDRIMKEKEGYFHLGYDTIKWQFSRYSSGQYTQDIYEIVLATFATLCQQKHNVICVLHDKDTRVKLIGLAKQHGYEVIEVNLEADLEVLLKRFDQRVAEAEANPEKKVANRTHERLKELFDIYQNEKNPDAIVFRTDQQSIEEVSSSILKLL